MLNDNKRFDISKPLDDTDKRIIARNLDMIEREKKSLSHSRDDWEQDQLIKKHEESERRMIREREESERRIAWEREQLEREKMEREEEYAEKMLEIEKELARDRAREEEESYQRELDYKQEVRRREMAVSYTEYDRYHELYYYYDERGDYLDAETARLRWQKLHCKSYTTFDLNDTFWQFFLDGDGKIITRGQAFELWQPDHCPDYLEYEDEGIWSIYRCNGEIIPAYKARKLWLVEKSGSHEVKKYNVKMLALQIANTMAVGTAPLPEIITNPAVSESGTEKEIARLRQENEDKKKVLRHTPIYKFFRFCAATAIILLALGSIGLAIWGMLKTKDKPHPSFWERFVFNPLYILASFPFVISGMIGTRKQYEKAAAGDKYYDEENDRLFNYSNNLHILSNHYWLNHNSDPIGNNESCEAALAEYMNTAKTVLSCIKESDDMKYLCDIKYFYNEVTAELSSEILEDDVYSALVIFLLFYKEIREAGFTFDREMGEMIKEHYYELIENGKSISVTLTYLSDKAAGEIEALFKEAGVKTTDRKRGIALLEKG